MTSSEPARPRAPHGCNLYFEASGESIERPRRILLISYHFPPDPAVGGLRWQKMLDHFAEQGWVADVVTRNFDSLKGIDPARLRSLAPGTRVFSVADREPMIGRMHRAIWPWMRARLAKEDVSRREAPTREVREAPKPKVVRGYLTWLMLAREESWARAAARCALDLAHGRRYAVVISSGPPHMAHAAARMVARRIKAPLVVDMRDPWSLVERHHPDVAGGVWTFLTGRHERRVLADAAIVTLNTEVSKRAMAEHYPAMAGRFEVVRNGADDEQLPAVRRDSVFRIRFAGSIYLDRDPRLVFRAASRVIKELSLSPGDFMMEFVGHVGSYAGTSVLEIADQEGIAGYVTVGGLLPRAEALRFLAGATMLLSLPQDSDFAIPAKIYEYASMKAWMLVLASTHSATAQVLQGTDAYVVDPADVDGMAEAIRDRYQAFVNGVMPSAAGADGRFDRRVQSGKLMDLIGKISPD